MYIFSENKKLVFLFYNLLPLNGLIVNIYFFLTWLIVKNIILVNNNVQSVSLCIL